MSEDMVTRLAAMTPSQRNDHKKRVLKIYAQADKMKPAELRAEISAQKEDDATDAERAPDVKTKANHGKTAKRNRESAGTNYADGSALCAASWSPTSAK